MYTRNCGACGKDIPEVEFGKHVDSHTASELLLWRPGGLEAARKAIEESRQVSRVMQGKPPRKGRVVFSPADATDPRPRRGSGVSADGTRGMQRGR